MLFTNNMFVEETSTWFGEELVTDEPSLHIVTWKKSHLKCKKYRISSEVNN